jgi:hypothetical protein
MNDGIHNGAAVQPSAINYRKLKSRRSYLGFTNAQIAQASGVSVDTVSAFLNGDETVRPSAQIAITRALKMHRVVDFQPIEADRGFAETVAGLGLKFLARYEPGRNCWVIVQEGALGSHEVGAFHGIENERMAKFCADRLNDAVGAK